MKNKIINTIQKILGESQITLTELSSKSGLPTSKLSRLLNQKQEMTLDELEIICKTLNLTTFDVIARSHHENILPNQTIDPEIDESICKNPLLFDLLELLQVPLSKKSMLQQLKIAEHKLTKGLNELIRLKLVYEDIDGNYRSNFSPFYSSKAFYEIMIEKLKLINKKTYEMGEVKEYWQNKSSIILHAYLDEEQLQNIKNLYRVILKLIENFQIYNQSPARKINTKNLTTLILINHPYECHKHE